MLISSEPFLVPFSVLFAFIVKIKALSGILKAYLRL